jgi:hypothetical protein
LEFVDDLLNARESLLVVWEDQHAPAWARRLRKAVQHWTPRGAIFHHVNGRSRRARTLHAEPCAFRACSISSLSSSLAPAPAMPVQEQSLLVNMLTTNTSEL